MSLGPTSLAAANAVSVQNVQFKSSAEVLPRKIVIIGTYDPAKTTVIDDTPKLVLSADDVGAQFGFGFMLHRLAVRAFEGSNGVETNVVPQAEVAGAPAVGDIDFVGSTGVLAGVLSLYIAGIVVPVSILKGTTAAGIATAVVAAVNADLDLPVTAVIGTPTSQVDFTSKSIGPWGDDIALTFNEGFGEEFPTGVTAVVVAMTGGAGTPDIDDALDGLGTGDNQNQDFFTDFIQGYGQDTTTLDKVSTYNGEGNLFVGNYDKLVARPFRALTGDVVAGSSGLTGALALSNARKLDRTNGTVAVPGSPNHPAEIAAVSIGVMAATNNIRAEESYIDKVLPGIFPGALVDQWTSEFNNRDIAVKDGVSPTVVKNGAIVLQNVLTYYHPDNVPLSSNGYRSQRNVGILQNLMNAIKINFGQDKWLGITIVADVAKVSNVDSRKKARDTNAVIDDLVVLARAFAGLAWIFTAEFTIDKLKDPSSVVIRVGGTGFDNTFSIILSGEGSILNTNVEFDTSLAVLTS